jgi:RIO kinase 1
MSYKDYEPVDLARANFKIHQLESLEIDNVENCFAGYISEVLGKINDGKEATVYLCASDKGELLAAKMFRAKHFRHFNTDHNYRNPGKHKDRRLGKAMRKKSKKGNAAFHRQWIASEWQYLKMLYDAGVTVPRPIAASNDGVLMEFVGGPDGAAPRLINAALDNDALERCGVLLGEEVERMLSIQVVHGDLSPYNILYHEDRPVIIDVPQAMEMHVTADAINMMRRDLENLDRYFSRHGVETGFFALLN